MDILVIFFIFLIPFASAIVTPENPDDNFYQEIIPGQVINISNPEYPLYYPASKPYFQQWKIKSPENTNITISCRDVDLPSSLYCQEDRLFVSLTGDPTLNDAMKYCSHMSFTATANTNTAVVGISAPADTHGGRFFCTLGAIQGPSNIPTTTTTTTTEAPNICNCNTTPTTTTTEAPNICNCNTTPTTTTTEAPNNCNCNTTPTTTTTTTTEAPNNCNCNTTPTTTTTTTTEAPNNCNCTRASSDECDCGWNYQTRILGGYESGINDFPAMAALVDVTSKNIFCGATIIAERYALTAAECIAGKDPSSAGLLVGDHNVETGTETVASEVYKLMKFNVALGYDEKEPTGMGILKTERPIKFHLYVGPACLPFQHKHDTFYGQNVIALGWGYTDYYGPRSDTLQRADLSVVSTEQCFTNQATNPMLPLLVEHAVCTYTPDKDACKFDYGGPLFWKDPATRKLKLIGILSYATDKCAGNTPLKSTKVAAYLEWIQMETDDAKYCYK